MPHLRFVYDKSMAEGVRMSALVDQAVASDKHLMDEPEQELAHDNDDEIDVHEEKS